MNNNRVVLETKNLCKTYYSTNEGVHVIKNLDLEIYDSDFTVIMGASGSGKTTLLYLLSSLDEVTSGNIYYKNIDLSKFDKNELIDYRRNNIGYIFQGINLIPYLSILENVSVVSNLATKNKKLAIKKSQDLLVSLDLKKEINRLPSEVSGGQQQRAAVARALVNDCDLLFADEPTGALNTSQGENLLNILSDINNKGKSIVMVTHDLKAACRANRVIYLKDGKIFGELSLPKFDIKNIEDREVEIYNFLRKRGW